MQTQDLIHIIEKTAPAHFAANWDKSGIQISAPQKDIHRLAVMLEPSLASISAALEQKADFLLTHHPLSLTARFPDKLDEYREILKLVLQSDTPLYAAHTSLDVYPPGPVQWLARELKLQQIEILEKTATEGELTVGFGFCGNLPKPATPTEFSTLLKNCGIATWRKIGERHNPISRVACCPGSGGSLAQTAFSLGADIFITGDIKYHQALEIAPLGCTLDVGHFILEEKMMYFWAKSLQQELQNKVEVFFLQGKDPFLYE